MDSNLSANEYIKADSDRLRGTLRESLDDELTGAISDDDTQIGKFHGFYQQDDRDVRQERTQRFLEPEYTFMLRARLPGGVCTSAQWLAIDDISTRLGNGSIRLTTRQTFQYHGIVKHHLKPLIQEINASMIDSIGGCGDINRNVLCNSNPQRSTLHQEVYEWAAKISDHLKPSTRAYHEIWLDGEKLETEEVEPIYGDTYLPRKFKTALAIPPDNDVDIYTNDLGFIAIEEDGELVGFNVLAGGGMGTTHGDESTFPRLADELGFVTLDQVLAVAEAVVKVQRDEGNRVVRRLARLKYTVERLGSERFKALVEEYAGVTFQDFRPIEFTHHGDHYGWSKGIDGLWNLTLYIENGRVDDASGKQIKQGLRNIAEHHDGDFRITANQNLIIAGVAEDQKQAIEARAVQFGLIDNGLSKVRLNSIACVAFPTCPQAMAESERYYPEFISKIEALLEKHGLSSLDTVIRMTGCPNGCARPFVAEIGIVGKAPGRYNLMLGGDGIGRRVNKLHAENQTEDGLLEAIDNILGQYADHHIPDERLGDFVVRHGIVPEVINPASDYHG